MQGWNDVEAYNDGLRARFRGEPRSWCPFPESSPRHLTWLDGWQVGWSNPAASGSDGELGTVAKGQPLSPSRAWGFRKSF